MKVRGLCDDFTEWVTPRSPRPGYYQFILRTGFTLGLIQVSAH